MRPFRYLALRLIVAVTVVWSFPTQAELPGPWVQAALLAQTPG